MDPYGIKEMPLTTASDVEPGMDDVDLGVRAPLSDVQDSLPVFGPTPDTVSNPSNYDSLATDVPFVASGSRHSTVEVSENVSTTVESNAEVIFSNGVSAMAATQYPKKTEEDADVTELMVHQLVYDLVDAISYGGSSSPTVDVNDELMVHQLVYDLVDAIRRESSPTMEVMNTLDSFENPLGCDVLNAFVKQELEEEDETTQFEPVYPVMVKVEVIEEDDAVPELRPSPPKRSRMENLEQCASSTPTASSLPSGDAQGAQADALNQSDHILVAQRMVKQEGQDPAFDELEKAGIYITFREDFHEQLVRKGVPVRFLGRKRAAPTQRPTHP